MEQHPVLQPQPIYTMVKKLAAITLIYDGKTLGAHFERFWRTRRSLCGDKPAFTISHIRQGHSVFVLVIRKRPGLKSVEIFKARLKLPDFILS